MSQKSLSSSIQQLEWGNVPNTALPPLCFLGGELRVCSFNAQGLFNRDPGKQQLKTAFVQDVASTRHIVCLQEVHGHNAEVLALLQSLLPGWLVMHSACPGVDGTSYSRAGGVAICVCPLLAEACTIFPNIIVPGRCIAASFCKGSCVLNVSNIHNFDLDANQMGVIAGLLGAQQRFDAQFPLLSCSIAVGDMNYMNKGERRYKAGIPIESSHNAIYTGNIHRSRWIKIFEDWTEICQPMPTCHSIQHETASRIDRGWTTSSTACLLNMTVASTVVTNPEIMASKQLSDHSVVDFVFGIHRTHSNFQAPIPAFLCKLDMFKSSLDILTEAIDIHNLPEERQLPALNRCINAAAKEVRNHLITHDAYGTEIARLVLSSIAKAVWKDDLKLAKTLIHTSPLARDHIYIQDGRICFVDHAAYDSQYNAARLELKNQTIQKLQKVAEVASSANSKKKATTKIKAQKRLRQLHWPKKQMHEAWGCSCL